MVRFLLSFILLSFSFYSAATFGQNLTSEQLSEAVGLMFQKIPELDRLSRELRERNLRLVTYGGTSRELIQATILGVQKAGSVETYMRELRAKDRVDFLDWHRLASDIDLMILGDEKKIESTSEIHSAVAKTFPESAFYKKIDLTWSKQFFNKFAPETDHYEATSNIPISDRGIEYIDELKTKIEGTEVHLTTWGVRQMISGSFEFAINQQLRADDAFRDIRQVLRWVRYITEFGWMKPTPESMVAIRTLLSRTSRREIIKLFRDGSSFDTEPRSRGDKIVQAIEKLQLYSVDPEKTIALLHEVGIADLMNAAEIAEARLLTPLPPRSAIAAARAKLGKKLGTEMKLYHRTKLSAAQNIGNGALWISNPKNIIAGSRMNSALTDAGFYASTRFGSLGYGDFHAEVTLSADAVEGIDYVKSGDFFALTTREAIARDINGRMKITGLSRRSLIQNQEQFLEYRGLTAEQGQATIRVLGSLLNPRDSYELNLLEKIIELEPRLRQRHDLSFPLESLLNRPEIIEFALLEPGHAGLQRLIFKSFEEHSYQMHLRMRILAIFVKSPRLSEKFADLIQKTLIKEAKGHLGEYILENPALVELLDRTDRSLLFDIAKKRPQKFLFDFSRADHKDLLAQILKTYAFYQHLNFYQHPQIVHPEFAKILNSMPFDRDIILLSIYQYNEFADRYKQAEALYGVNANHFKDFKKWTEHPRDMTWEKLRTIQAYYGIQSIAELHAWGWESRAQALNALYQLSGFDPYLEREFDKLQSLLLTHVSKHHLQREARVFLEVPEVYLKQLTLEQQELLIEVARSALMPRQVEHLCRILSAQKNLPAWFFRSLMTSQSEKLISSFQKGLLQPSPEQSKEIKLALQDIFSSDRRVRIKNQFAVQHLYGGKYWTDHVFNQVLQAWKKPNKQLSEEAHITLDRLIQNAPKLPADWREFALHIIRTEDRERFPRLVDLILLRKPVDVEIETTLMEKMKSSSDLTASVLWRLARSAERWENKVDRYYISPRMWELVLEKASTHPEAKIILSGILSNSAEIWPEAAWNWVPSLLQIKEGSKNSRLDALADRLQEVKTWPRHIVKKLPGRFTRAFRKLEYSSRYLIERIEENVRQGKITIEGESKLTQMTNVARDFMTRIRNFHQPPALPRCQDLFLIPKTR